MDETLTLKGTLETYQRALEAAGRRAREAEAESARLRAELADIAKQWPDSFAARSARAALAKPRLRQ